MEKILCYLKLGVEEGAKVLTGGERAMMTGDLKDGYFVQPTVFAGHNKMRIFQQEIFGPVVSVRSSRAKQKRWRSPTTRSTASAPQCGAATAPEPSAWVARSRPAGCGPTASRPRTCWSATARTHSGSSDGLVFMSGVPTRVDATPAALALIEQLRAQHGALLFHPSGGCCDGSAPMCFPRIEFMIGDIAGVPFSMSRSQFEYGEQTHLTIDAIPGTGGMFSLERLYEDDEWKALPQLK